jgi:hypothetical protein
MVDKWVPMNNKMLKKANEITRSEIVGAESAGSD